MAREEECSWCSPGSWGQIPTSSRPASPGWGCRWRSVAGTRRREATPRSGTVDPASQTRLRARGPTTAGSLRNSWDVCCRPTVHSGWTSPGGAKANWTIQVVTVSEWGINALKGDTARGPLTYNVIWVTLEKQLLLVSDSLGSEAKAP